MGSFFLSGNCLRRCSPVSCSVLRVFERFTSGLLSLKVTSVESVKPIGGMGLMLMGKGQSKELELEAEDAATRDTWVRSRFG